MQSRHQVALNWFNSQISQCTCPKDFSITLDVEFMYTNIDNEQGMEAVNPQVFRWSADISKLQCYLFRLKNRLALQKRRVGGQRPKWWWHHYKRGCWPLWDRSSSTVRQRNLQTEKLQIDVMCESVLICVVFVQPMSTIAAHPHPLPPLKEIVTDKLSWLYPGAIQRHRGIRSRDKIGILCGYAIRSGRHPEGSQRPPGRPQVGPGRWLPSGCLPDRIGQSTG